MDPSSSRRRRRDGHDDDEPLEEGEFVPRGYYSSASESDTDDDDDDSGYYSLQSRREEEIHPQSSRVRRLEDILAMGRDAAALPSPTPSIDPESDGTISDDGGSPSSMIGGVAAAVFSCHVCGKGFGSPKAVAGHMRVHDPRGRVVAVDAGWAATGKRGWTAGGSKGKSVVSSSAEELSHSTMEGTVLQPMPLSFARSNPSSSLSMASAKTNLDTGESSSPKSVHNEVVVPPVVNNPSTEAVVHPPPAEAQQADPHQIVLQLAPAVPPPAAAVPGHQGPAAAPRREYTCKLCGASYPTHQGLGGHAAGHRNRQKEAEAAAAAAGIAQDCSAAARGGGNRKVHACDECDRVFPTGVALGGHKRKHWKGGPIVQKRNKKQYVAPPLVAPSLDTPAVYMADLTLQLGIKSGQTSVSPAAAGRLRLFGIDIGLPPQAPAAPQQGTDTSRQAEAPAVQDEEGSAVTEDSAAAGVQQQDDKVEKSSTDSLSKESSN